MYMHNPLFLLSHTHITRTRAGFYLKLGQILATKTDMLPKPYTDSLLRLLDKMPPMAFARVKRSVQRELRAPVDRAFDSIDTFPLASATVAQASRLGSDAWVLESGFLFPTPQHSTHTHAQC